MQIIVSTSKLKHGFRVGGAMLYVDKGANQVEDDTLKELKKDAEFKQLLKDKVFIVGSNAENKNEKKAETLIKDAEDDALEIMQKAEDRAKKLIDSAEEKVKKANDDAEEIVSKAEDKAKKLVSDAEAKAAKLVPKEA